MLSNFTITLDLFVVRALALFYRAKALTTNLELFTPTYFGKTISIHLRTSAYICGQKIPTQMLNKIWQFIKQLIQRLFGTQPSPTPAQQKPPPPTLTDAEYEAKFMELLEGVSQGWSRGNIAGFLIAKSLKNAELAAWLRRFGDRLFEEGGHGGTAPTDAVVASLQELAQRLLLLSRISDGELGNIAREISRELLARFPLPIVEEDVGYGNVIEAVFIGDGLGIISD